MALTLGRAEEIRAVTDAVTRGRAVVISGPLGVGKSHVLRQVVDSLANSWWIAPIVANQAAATIPFGAVATMLPPADVTDQHVEPGSPRRLAEGRPGQLAVQAIDHRAEVEEEAAERDPAELAGGEHPGRDEDEHHRDRGELVRRHRRVDEHDRERSRHELVQVAPDRAPRLRAPGVGEDDALDEPNARREVGGGRVVLANLGDDRAEMRVAGLGVIDPPAGLAHRRIEDGLLGRGMHVELVHDPIEQVAEDLFLVRGCVKLNALMTITRNMVVVRHGGDLTLVDPIRLDATEEARLRSLGEVRRVVRLGPFHGMDDRYFLDTFGAEYWTPGPSEQHPEP